jgi:hypothetical protein
VQIVVLYKDGARTDTFFSNSETRARVEPMLYNIFEAESQKKSLRDCGVNTTEEWPTEVKAKTPAKRKQSSSGDGIGQKSAKKKKAIKQVLEMKLPFQKSHYRKHETWLGLATWLLSPLASTSISIII